MSLLVVANNMNQPSLAIRHDTRTDWGSMSAIVVANNTRDTKTMGTDYMSMPDTDRTVVDGDNRWEFDCNKRNDFEPVV